MAVFHGKTAKVVFTGKPGLITALTGWSLDASADVAESTVMDPTTVSVLTHWQAFERGFDDATATVDGNAQTERDTVAQIGQEASLELYIDATNFFSFNALCTGISESVDKDDIGKISYSFEMNDAAGVQYN